MDLQPDVLNPGQRRMHFNGVPIYLAPIRDDEDSGGPGFPTGNGVAPDTTSVYAAIIGGETGVRILYSGGDDENFGLTSESGNSSGIDYYQAFGRYTLFIPERTAVARLHGVTLTV